MPSADYDLRYVQAGLDMLEAYLLADDLYWPMNATPPRGEPPYPQMTPGGLLLSLQRLQATAQTPTEQAELRRLELRFQATITPWRTAWGKKVRTDFGARLRLWTGFLNEYREAPAAQYDRYSYEVSRRVQLHLLEKEVRDLPPVERESLDGLDALLRALFVPGDFIWQTALEPAFPAQPYWYLYGALRQE